MEHHIEIFICYKSALFSDEIFYQSQIYNFTKIIIFLSVRSPTYLSGVWCCIATESWLVPTTPPCPALQYSLRHQQLAACQSNNETISPSRVLPLSGRDSFVFRYQALLGQNCRSLPQTSLSLPIFPKQHIFQENNCYLNMLISHCIVACCHILHWCYGGTDCHWRLLCIIII